MGNPHVERSAFYTGLVAQIYRHLRSQSFDPEPYARFVARVGEPALELGCGDGDPILELRSRGLDVEGLDSSADMLARCRAEAQARGIDVVLHQASFQSMELGRKYRSIYLAGATFNLLPDDAAAQQALHRIAAHLELGGSALIPLFVPQSDDVGAVGHTRQHVTGDGRIMRFTVLSIDRDDSSRVLTSRQRYELMDSDDVQSLERDWVVHWFHQQQFREMAAAAGLTVHAVLASDGTTAHSDATSFTFWLRLDDNRLDDTGSDGTS